MVTAALKTSVPGQMLERDEAVARGRQMRQEIVALSQKVLRREWERVKAAI